MEQLPEVAIEVKNLHVFYKNMEAYSIKQNFFELLKRNKVSTFEAVKGVSFTVRKGEIIGIIGKNGSGKSTLLRTLGGIFSPNEGSINLFGNSVSLLSIGVGFQGNLTGRNNIMISGLLLGFTEQQILDRMEEIIEFSGLKEFIDKPVKTYSSGMYSKLGFSIGVILETDILLVDEVLSVGDEQFRKKSFDKMRQLIADKNRTVVIVSHSMGQIQSLCDEVIWLHDGKIKMQGQARLVVKEYMEFWRR